MKEVKKQETLAKHDKAGLLSTFRGSSKFIITCAPAPWLDSDYVVFGEVLGDDSNAVVKDTIDKYGAISRRPRADIVISGCGIVSPPAKCKEKMTEAGEKALDLTAEPPACDKGVRDVETSTGTP